MSAEDLFKNASIQIYDYGLHRRTEMNQRNRLFPFYVMSYISEGHAILRIGEREIELAPKSVILVPPGMEHDHIMRRRETTVFWWWHFDCTLYGTIDLLRLLQMPLVYTIQNNEGFETAFERYREAMQQSNSLQNMLHTHACILEVLAWLLGAAEVYQPGSTLPIGVPGTFLDMLQLIASGEVNDMSLEYLSRRFNMHPTYISNRFKQYFGIAPIQLHRRLQLQRAREMLSSGHRSVSEVAELFGYSDVSVFSRAFETQMGYPPTKAMKR